MKLELLRAVDLTASEVKALQRLSFGKQGSLMYELDDARHYHESFTRVVRLTDNGGRIISWALVRKRPGPGDKWDFQCYTRKSHRRKGFAKIVYDKAVQVSHGRHNMVVHPHDQWCAGPANAFYDKVHFDKEGYVLTKKTDLRKQLHKEVFTN
jgi:hypothetical protein